MQKIPFLQMPRGVSFKKYRANDLEETCNHPNLWPKQLKLNTSVNWTSSDFSCHLSLSIGEMVQTTNSYSWWILRIRMGVYQAIRQEKVYTQGQLKLTCINFVILNIRFVKTQKHLFLDSYKHKIWTQLYWLFSYKKTYYIKNDICQKILYISKFVKKYI